MWINIQIFNDLLFKKCVKYNNFVFKCISSNYINKKLTLIFFFYLCFSCLNKQPLLTSLSIVQNHHTWWHTMVPLKDNVDLECFLVTKHSWKGKYKRILSVGTAGISTYNPDKFDVTNRWAYADVLAVTVNKSPQTPHEFQLIVRKDRKSDTIKLSSEYRAEIMTAMLRFYREFHDRPKNIQVVLLELRKMVLNVLNAWIFFCRNTMVKSITGPVLVFPPCWKWHPARWTN